MSGKNRILNFLSYILDYAPIIVTVLFATVASLIATNNGSDVYRFFNPKTKRVTLSRDVKWLGTDAGDKNISNKNKNNNEQKLKLKRKKKRKFRM